MEIINLINKKIIALFFLGSILMLALVACGNHDHRMELPGYVEGEYVYVSSAYSGILSKVNVTMGDSVAPNQPLYSMDHHPEQDELLEADARIEQAQSERQKLQANYKLQKSVFDRKQGLYNKKVISQEEFDSANSLYQQANSGLLAAEANILALTWQRKKIDWIIKQKNLSSPVAGIVTDIYYKAGENIPGNSPVLALLIKDKIKVIFYCPETEISNIKLNQLISVTCDNCSGTNQAKITYISPQSTFTPPVLYSTEMRSSLSYRIEALLLASNALPLHPGQPVTIRLEGPSDDAR